VCGVELGAEGQMVLDYSARLAHAWQEELVIVHVVPDRSNAMLVLYGLDETVEIELLPKGAQHKVARMAAGLAVPYQVDVRIGDVAECLHGAAKRHSADLMIVGRGKRTDRWRLGANIGDIVARSSTPVISCAADCRPPRRIPTGTSARTHSLVGVPQFSGC
jgi:nucleotide-binding universal stress UspA family protein